MSDNADLEFLTVAVTRIADMCDDELIIEPLTDIVIALNAKLLFDGIPQETKDNLSEFIKNTQEYEVIAISEPYAKTMVDSVLETTPIDEAIMKTFKGMTENADLIHVMRELQKRKLMQ